MRAWWRDKADEIYRAIPDFGGFLVKANSEGQPGPQDYGRSHADGANMLAEALAPHGGIVMWRAFVYSQEQPADRATQAYTEFAPLDGKFHSGVFIQMKNGPIDFQPREPFHPLFGAMPHTPLMLEVQITKEYLGFATHLAYLAPMWRGDARLRHLCRGTARGSTVRRRHLLGHSGMRRRQHRRRSQLVRVGIRSGQLVCVRPSGVGSGSQVRRDRGTNGCA